jgi:hypothetical protein
MSIETPVQEYIPSEMEFRFKKDKLGNKRPNVKVTAKTLSLAGLVGVLNKGDEKEVNLVLEYVNSAFRDVIADKVGDDETFDQTKLDAMKLDWTFIANMPKEDRRSSSIAKEVWEAFVADYIAVMPGLTNTSAEATALATEIYVKKMAPAKSNKPVLERLKQRLAMYAETSRAEEFSEILELLVRRIDTYMKADQPELVAENL